MELNVEVMVVAAFTQAERDRASEIRRYAEERAHWDNEPPDPASPPLHDEKDTVRRGGVFSRVRTIYSIARREGRLWRLISFSLPGNDEPPYPVCAAIAICLFGFVNDDTLEEAQCLNEPAIHGLIQPWEPPS